MTNSEAPSGLNARLAGARRDVDLVDDLLPRQEDLVHPTRRRDIQVAEAVGECHAGAGHGTAGDHEGRDEHAQEPGQGGHRGRPWRGRSAVRYRLRLTSSWSISSEVVITRPLAWNPRWAVIIPVNCVARSTLDISSDCRS